MRLRLMSLTIAACLALAPAGATSNHQYAKGEYGVIRDGLAPNKQLSLASHGDGELGDDHFHVWLMAEPAHRKLVAVDDISDDNNLDTAPDAYHAYWSKDSRRVGVAFRSSRHEVTLNLYRIEGRRAYLIKSPDLFTEVMRREVTDDDGLRQRISMVEWRGGNRFVLREFKSFVVDDDRLLKLFGKYGSLAEKMEDGKLFIQFVANADCELLPGGRVRVIDVTAGKPGDADKWWDPS
jgi:hypothetical protein